MAEINNSESIKQQYRDMIRTLDREIEAVDPEEKDTELQEALELVRNRLIYPVIDDEREFA